GSLAGVGSNPALNTNRREKHGDTSKDAEQLHEEARLAEGFLQDALHRGDIGYRLIGIDFGDNTLHEHREVGGGIRAGGRSQDQGFVEMGTCGATWEDGGLLRERRVDKWRCLLAEAKVLCGADDTDGLPRGD